MEIIIEKNGIKRQLTGSFRICGSKEDLLRISEILRKEAEDFSYGWVEIHKTLPAVPNLKPIPWEVEVT